MVRNARAATNPPSASTATKKLTGQLSRAPRLQSKLANAKAIASHVSAMPIAMATAMPRSGSAHQRHRGRRGPDEQCGRDEHADDLRRLRDRDRHEDQEREADRAHGNARAARRLRRDARVQERPVDRGEDRESEHADRRATMRSSAGSMSKIDPKSNDVRCVGERRLQVQEERADTERECEDESRRDVAFPRAIAERADGRRGADGERDQAPQRIEAREHRARAAR